MVLIRTCCLGAGELLLLDSGYVSFTGRRRRKPAVRKAAYFRGIKFCQSSAFTTVVFFLIFCYLSKIAEAIEQKKAKLRELHAEIFGKDRLPLLIESALLFYLKHVAPFDQDPIDVEEAEEEEGDSPVAPKLDEEETGTFDAVAFDAALEELRCEGRIAISVKEGPVTADEKSAGEGSAGCNIGKDSGRVGEVVKPLHADQTDLIVRQELVCCQILPHSLLHYLL